MKRLTKLCITASALVLATWVHAAVITVNTTDNTDFNAGVTNLVTAITNLTSGDTINFAISGPPPHRIMTPVGGYPILTNLTGITINGYSQGDSSPNTHAILSSNNANITIILDSSNGECTDLTGINGYDTEGAILPMLGCTNVNISGLCFLGINPGGIANNMDNIYGIAMGGGASTANVHIHGCRFGLDADGTTVKQLQKDIVTYGNRNTGFFNLGVAPGSANPMAEFNVFIGGYILFDIGPGSAGCLIHVSGNFLNVYPDGLHDFNVDGLTHGGVDHIVEALFEFASSGTNSVFGTDGDGVNDAEERNVIGGITAANDNNLFETYGSGGQSLRICGNYFGVGIDGVTRFNSGGPTMQWLDDHKKNNSSMIIGSDFDGVSDDIEGNLFYWNTPFTALYGDPSTNAVNQFEPWAFHNGPPNNLPADKFTGFFSVRGNQMVNNLNGFETYANGLSDLFPRFFAQSSPFMDTSAASVPDDLLPKLSASTTAADIIGTCLGTNGIVYTNNGVVGSYTNIFIDVYELDPEGWANGKKFHLAELTDNTTYTNGFAQGKRFLGTFVDNGPLDRDPVVGHFNLNASALGLTPGTDITVTANYSTDPAGTHNARTHTSDFSYPVTLRAPVKITSVTSSGTTLTINWSGGAAPYTLQKKSPVALGGWANVATGIAGTSQTDTISGLEAYYRVLGH